MLEITAVQELQDQIKVAWGPWLELRRKGPIFNEEEDEKHIYFGIWGT